VQLDHARLARVFGMAETRRHFAAAGIDTAAADRLFRDAILHRPMLSMPGTTGVMLNADLFPRDEYYINNRLGAATVTAPKPGT
jgi:hypothetical protein